jgi:hypothetical protein
MDDGWRYPPSLVAIWPSRGFRVSRFVFCFDKGPPGPIGRGPMVDHAELLPPSPECHRRLPGLAARIPSNGNHRRLYPGRRVSPTP